MSRCFRRVLLAALLLQAMLASAVAIATDVTLLGVSPYPLGAPPGATQHLTVTGYFSDATDATLTKSTLAAGGNHTCAVVGDGSVRCWGRNGNGQLGNGTTTDSSLPVAAGLFGTITAVAAGGDSSCALLFNGGVRCWGLNDLGQLGNGTTTSSLGPVIVSGITAVDIAVGFRHACALVANGGVSCWGGNASGQLGNGTLIGATTAVGVTGISTATAIATGGNHSCAVLAAGGVKCWGDNSSGQLGNGNLTGSSSPVDVSGISNAVGIVTGFNHSCALLADGAVRCWGANSNGQLGNGGTVSSSTPVTPTGSLGQVVALGAGSSHTCAVVEGGSSYCWGRNANGQQGNGTLVGNFPTPGIVSGIDSAIAISGGFEHTCALLSDGNMNCWGLNDTGQLGIGVSGGANQRSGVPLTVNGPVLGVDAGGNHTCIYTPTGIASCWGNGIYGQVGDGETLVRSLPVKVNALDTWVGAAVNAVGLALGFDHTCAVLSDGEAKCWGRSNAGQLGNNAIVAQSPVPVGVYQMTTAMSLASGSAHTCAVLTTGGVQCWGNNNLGALGNSDPANSTFPKTVAGITTALSISAGFEHTCVVLASGTVQCWGRGDEGQLGNGSTASSSSPVTVSGITTATWVGLGNYHSCARLSNGELRCWGRNVEGQLGNASNTGSSVPVTVSGISNASVVVGGGYHTCARLTTGGARCWGRGDLGQLGNGFFVNINSPVVVTGISSALAIDAGRSHTCALLAGGILQCWGYNEFGQLGVGTLGAGVNSATPATVNGINMDAVGLSFTSSNTSVATVDAGGYVHAVAPGTTTLTTYYDGKKRTDTFTVAADTDTDGVIDPFDNCIDVANPDQVDADSDGYGNPCDGDLNNNGFTNSQDYVLFRARLGNSGTAPYDIADFNTNGFVNSQDYILFRNLLGKPSGPSGLHP